MVRKSIIVKAVSQQSCLINHQHIHIGELPYKYEVFNKSYSQHSVLKVYQDIYIGEHPYTCQVYCIPDALAKRFDEARRVLDFEESHTLS